VNIILLEYDDQKEWSAINVGKKIFIAGLVRDGFTNVALVGTLIIRQLEQFFTRHIHRCNVGSSPFFLLHRTNEESLLSTCLSRLGYLIPLHGLCFSGYVTLWLSEMHSINSLVV